MVTPSASSVTEARRAPWVIWMPRLPTSARSAAPSWALRRQRNRVSGSSCAPSGALLSTAPSSANTVIEVSAKPTSATGAAASIWPSACIPLLARVRKAPMSSPVSGCAS